MRAVLKLSLPVLLLLPLAAQGDSPPTVVLATPGSAMPGSGTIDRFTIRFSQAMVPLGDPRAKPAASSDCPGASAGRWVDPQTFVIDFQRPLPGGTSCKVKLREGLATQSGIRLSTGAAYSIDTAGPSVRAVLAPGESGSDIDEDQVFLVATNTQADPASVAAKAGCAIDGIGETAAVDVLPAGTAESVVAGLGDDDWHLRDFLGEAEIAMPLPKNAAARSAALSNVLALRCRRPLPPEKDMALVWPKTVADRHGKLAGRDQRFDFTVRSAFTATFECTRANGKAACSPITPVHLSFSAPLDRSAALAVRLRLADGSERAPAIDPGQKENAQVSALDFAGPFPAASAASVVLPPLIKDLSGRSLANAARFPLPISFAATPPLVKFAADFGIIEAREGAQLPVTVRAVEPALAGKITSIAGQSVQIADDDAQIAQWVRKLEHAEDRNYQWVERKGQTPFAINHTREKPLLPPGAAGLQLPLPGKGKDFEVVAIPLGGKGFHVVELASPALGSALLGRPVPRYVASGALVTDLAVHFKWGREGSLVWVTSLADALPAAGAMVRISDSCTGRLIASGQTDAAGLLTIGAVLGEPSTGGGCDPDDTHPLMVSARLAGDMSFTLSNWTQGISPDDFELPYGFNDDQDLIHTVFDRALVRVGETVHFKHILRRPVGAGFAMAKGFTGKLTFNHMGSDTEFSQPVTIGPDGSAEGQWAVPQGAPLGDYAVRFELGKQVLSSGQSIRVDEYKLPNMRAAITGPATALVQPTSVPLSLFVGYLSGGGAGQLPVTVRSDFTDWVPAPKGWDGYNFGGADVIEGTRPLGGDGAEDSVSADLPFAQTLPVTLGADGTAHADIAVGNPVSDPVTLMVEMDYPDANGETMTAGRRLTLYPAALQVGLRTDGWMMRDDDLRFKLAVLGLDGQPLVAKQVTVDLYSRRVITARRRLIGGFYAYDNQEEVKKLPQSCHTATDRLGRANCQLAPGVSGEVTAVARVRDDAGRESRAVQSVWLAGKDDWWFGGDNGDRMDVIPEQTEYRSGDTARFQVRMPFREATALVTVEREGVLSSFVTKLSGTDPVVEVKLPASYAPNVFVSVMAVRGRVTGGESWMVKLAEGLGMPVGSDQKVSPTATIDLAKPSYRIGMTQVKVGWEGHKLGVTVKPERDRYGVRETANVAVAVTTPDGKPAQSADLAFVAVDEALLQLMPNPSWDVLDAMMGKRSLEVTTSTAQMQVVGKRHYGKKAVIAGGGGGDSSGVNRENFQPVLLWKGRVALDASGRAVVPVPLSDALSSFRLVAVATQGAQLFGMGSAELRTAQDLSAYPGLPPLVRTGDRFDAVFTLRNGTDKPMKLTAAPTVVPAIAQLAPQTVTVPAGGATTLRWNIAAPADPGVLKWTLSARSADGKSSDSVSASQEVASAVPVEVWAASLLRVGDPAPAIAAPEGALPGGFVTIALSDSLAAPLAGVRDYMQLYPYNCFEQRLSRIVASGDNTGWKALADALPTYLDSDGLVRYWPDARATGSPELTAYVLATASEAGLTIPDGPRQKMVGALTRVVEGKTVRTRPIRVDERPLRIAALAALARAGAADPRLIARIDMVPADMPTSALADWIVSLDRLRGYPRATVLRAAAEGELRRRLVYEGTRLDLADAQKVPWWMMTSADEMAIKALDAVIGKPGWASEVPKMMTGMAARQMRGHWDTTPANAWGVLVTRRFAAAYPASAIAGTTRIALGSASFAVPWPRSNPGELLRLPLIDAPLFLSQSGGAGPWATVTVHAAVPLKAPLMAGYRLTRSVGVISAREPGKLSQGDVVRVRLTIEAAAERNWVVLNDPLLPGATVMSGLGGQSQLLEGAAVQAGAAAGGGAVGADSDAMSDGASGGWASYTESSHGSWRAYFDWLPRGTTVIEYTMRINTAGTFALPPSRVEAMYAPAIRAQLPIAPVTVWAN